MNPGRFPAVLFFVLAVVFPPGCGTNEAATPPSGGEDVVVVENAGRTLRFADSPRRAVTMNHNGTELFLSLGLRDRMVGTAWRDHAILPRLREAYESVPVLSGRYPSLEVLLEADPDFVYGWRSAFTPPKGPATMERLDSFGITPYLDLTYADTRVQLSDVFEEIRTIGRIFRVEAKADSLVRRMQSRIRAAQSEVPREGAPLRVAVYHQGRDTFYGSGPSLVSDLLERLHARNVLADDIPDNYGPVSWETVARENPDVFVVMRYGSTPAEDKIQRLKQHPGLETVTAVRRGRFVTLPLASTFPGVRNARAVRRLAEGLYPDHAAAAAR